MTAVVSSTKKVGGSRTQICTPEPLERCPASNHALAGRLDRTRQPGAWRRGGALTLADLPMRAPRLRAVLEGGGVAAAALLRHALTSLSRVIDFYGTHATLNR